MGVSIHWHRSTPPFSGRPLLSFEYSASFHTVIGVNRIDSARSVEMNPGSKASVNGRKCVTHQAGVLKHVIVPKIKLFIIHAARGGVSRPRLRT